MMCFFLGAVLVGVNPSVESVQSKTSTIIDFDGKREASAHTPCGTNDDVDGVTTKGISKVELPRSLCDGHPDVYWKSHWLRIFSLKFGGEGRAFFGGIES